MLGLSLSLTNLLAALTTVLICTWIFMRYREARLYPPGPIPLPLLGNLYNVAGHEGMMEFYKYNQEKYGDVRKYIILLVLSICLQLPIIHKRRYL